MEPIRAVIFDLDGTLYPMTRRFRPLFAFFSIPHPLRLPGYMKLRDKFRGEARDCGKTIMTEINQEIETLFGVKSGELWQERQFYPAFYRTLACTRKRPGVNQLLAELKAKGYRLAVLSDFGKVPERLQALKISSEPFEFLFSSEDLGGFKPNTLPFLKTLTAFNLPPEAVLMVGDREETDGDGARSMGMPFLKVPGKSSEGWDEAVQFLRDLPPIRGAASA